MNSKPVRVLDEKWDYLIVLDACRYDCFEKFYKDYLPDGVLSKKISLGTNTPEWLKKNFRNGCEAIYITGNPTVSSVKAVGKFSVQYKFSKVYNVWHDIWNDKLNTVVPQALSERAVKIINAHPGQKLIIHYMQPHEPYLTYYNEHFSFPKKSPLVPRLIFSCISKFLTCIRQYNRRLRWTIAEMLRLEPSSQMFWLLKDKGEEGLRSCYEENLRQALKAVQSLVEYLSGKIVVTADHGEVLGENGLYGHWPHSKHPILKEVPWLIIEKKQKTKTSTDSISGHVDKDATKEEIEKKLRLLGY